MTGETERARSAMYALKRDSRLTITGTPTTAEYFGRTLGAGIRSCPELAEIINSKAVLIPAPSSSLSVGNGLWVPERLCRAMVANGFGAQVIPCIRRTKAVRKSATAPPSERPDSEEHFKSMSIHNPPAEWPDQVVIVDDMVTRGATLIGAANRLVASGCTSTIVAFGMMRAISSTPSFKNLFDPVVGQITLHPFGSTHREP